MMRRLSLGLLLLVSALPSSGAPANVPEALQNVRRHLLDADINSLTFHSIDQIFDTRRVDNGTQTWKLERSEKPLDLSYSHAGHSYPVQEGLTRTFTNAFIVVKHGKIVSEIYRNKTDEKTHFISFSMAKSFTSTLIGLAVADGHIHSIDDPMTKYVPELRGSAYDGVTIKQALMMRSGADYEERYDFNRPGLAAAAFEESLVENRIRFAAFGLVLNRAYPPGEHFNYSTIETALLGWVLERATGDTLSHYMSEKLWKPLGAESYGFWIMDGPEKVGREFNGAGFNAVARDYARFGLLMLHEGTVHGRQILTREWVQEATSPHGTQPVSPDFPLGYKYQWWTVPGTEAYMALGLQGQYIYVDPATDTVIVKLSYFPPGNLEAEIETIDLLKAVSAWSP